MGTIRLAASILALLLTLPDGYMNTHIRIHEIASDLLPGFQQICSHYCTKRNESNGHVGDVTPWTSDGNQEYESHCSASNFPFQLDNERVIVLTFMFGLHRYITLIRFWTNQSAIPHSMFSLPFHSSG